MTEIKCHIVQLKFSCGLQWNAEFSPEFCEGLSGKTSISGTNSVIKTAMPINELANLLYKL